MKKGPEYVPDPNDAPETTEEGLVLKFHDEFNGTGEPDWNVWRWEEGFQRNQELQWYQKENAICKDGALIITGKEERVKIRIMKLEVATGKRIVNMLSILRAA